MTEGPTLVRLGGICICILVAWPCASHAEGTGRAPFLWTVAPNVDQPTGARGQLGSHKHEVQLDRGAISPLFSGELQSAHISLIGGFHVTLNSIEALPDMPSAVLGRVSQFPDGYVLLTQAGSEIAANVHLPAYGEFQLRTGPDGRLLLSEVVTEAFPPCASLNPTNGPSPALGTMRDASPRWIARNQSPRASSDDGSMIDVMVVYTLAARIAAGGPDAMNALIDLAVSETNLAYANSDIQTRLRLVYKGEVAYTESGDFPLDLNRLRQIGDGYLENVHALRDEYGADVVSLFVESGSFCGIAPVMTFVSPSFASLAFSVVNYSCAAGNLSFAHEVGHNMGCVHDRNNSCSENDCGEQCCPVHPQRGLIVGAFDYSFGYQDPDEVFRTIMALDCPSCPRVTYFANPQVIYQGSPTGVPEGDAWASDTARTINETASTVANFRPSDFHDCNLNEVADPVDIANGVSADCDANGLPDECDGPCAGDCACDDGVYCNGVEECDVGSGLCVARIPTSDCNENGVPDECEIDASSQATGGPFLCATDCDPDCNENGVPDDCDADCNFNLTPDDCDIDSGFSDDCSGNGMPDECEPDCQPNGSADSCDLASGASDDCNGNRVPDECESDADCNLNTIADICDIASGFSADCGGDGVPDECAGCLSNCECDDLDPCTFDVCQVDSCVHIPSLHGDVAGPSASGFNCGPDGQVNIFDIFAVLDAFLGSFADQCVPANLDLAGPAGTCTPDGSVDVFDILAMLDAFLESDGCCPSGK